MQGGAKWRERSPWKEITSESFLPPPLSAAQDKHSSLPSQDKQRRCPREPIWVEIETLDADDETTF